VPRLPGGRCPRTVQNLVCKLYRGYRSSAQLTPAVLPSAASADNGPMDEIALRQIARVAGGAFGFLIFSRAFDGCDLKCISCSSGLCGRVIEKKRDALEPNCDEGRPRPMR
jgi:hypothetical protein